MKKILKFLTHHFTVNVNETDIPYLRIGSCTKHVIILEDSDHRCGHMYVNIGAVELRERLDMTPLQLRDYLTAHNAKKKKRQKRVVIYSLYD